MNRTLAKALDLYNDPRFILPQLAPPELKTILAAARERLEIESGNAILIRKDDDGNWPGWVETCGAYVRWENNRKSWAVQTVGEVLDFLLIALAEQADKADKAAAE